MNFSKLAGYTAIISALVCVTLFFVRLYYAVSFFEPLQTSTSGAEYESLYVVWKYINGMTIYADHMKIPFAGTFYNWLYYVFYGELTGGILAAFDLADSWIPTITKLITVAGTLAGVGIAYLTFGLIAPNEPAPSSSWLALRISFSIFLFMGPLVGFFGMAAQPDIWAMVFDISAVYVFIRFFTFRPLVAVVGFCLLAYIAWSFKQIFVFSPGAVGLYLLWRREFKWLGALTFLMCSFWAATLWVGDPQYVKTMIKFGGTKVTLLGEQLLRNLTNAGVKLFPVILGLAGIFSVVISSKPWKVIREPERPQQAGFGPHNILLLALMGIAISGLIAIPASAKQGAAENYYFVFTFFACIAVLSSYRIMLLRGLSHNMFYIVITVGWVLNFLAVGSVFAGINGVISTRPGHSSMTSQAQCLRNLNLPQPTFVAHQYLSLPWMYPADQHFVLHTSYYWDRTAGIKMEGGGLGGLMDTGYFASLAVSVNKHGQFDGSDLSRYQKVPSSCDLSIFIRKK
jgi:hypothetical protein